MSWTKTWGIEGGVQRFTELLCGALFSCLQCG